jgi:hypothetical protein
VCVDATLGTISSSSYPHSSPLFLIILFLMFLLRSLSLNDLCVSTRRYAQFPYPHHMLSICFNETVRYVGRSYYSWWVLPSQKCHSGDSWLVHPLHSTSVPGGISRRASSNNYICNRSRNKEVISTTVNLELAFCFSHTNLSIIQRIGIILRKNYNTPYLLNQICIDVK